MKIALVIGKYDAQGGGAERWTDRYARWLVTEGHEVHLVAKCFRDVPSEATCHLVKTSRWSTSSRLQFAEQAEQILKSNRFDVIHDMGDGWYADLFMPHHGTRTGLFVQNTATLSPLLRAPRKLANRLLPRYRQFRQLEQRQYNTQDGRLFIALSGMVRDEMQRYMSLPADRIRLIYNGVDSGRFQPVRDLEKRTELRKSLKIDDRVVFLMVAHDFKRKGLDAALQALARLVRANQKAVLVTIGGDKDAAYRRLAEKLGCSDAVQFLGNCSDPVAYYHAADVCVLPTFYDPCSLTILEALACGLPVITSRYNGVSELIQHGQEGYVLDDPQDIESLAEYMTTMLDADVRKTLGARALALGKHHSIQRNYEEMFQLYGSIANRR